MARVLRAPVVFHDTVLARYFDENAKAQWTLSPLDRTARQKFADEASLAQMCDIELVTHGVAFIEVNGGHECVFVELYLPTSNDHNTSISPYDDWLRTLAPRRMISTRKHSCACTSHLADCKSRTSLHCRLASASRLPTPNSTLLLAQSNGQAKNSRRRFMTSYARVNCHP